MKKVQQSLLIKRLRPQPNEVEDDDYYEIVELDLHRSYQRPKLIEIDDEDLSDRIKFRLWLARNLALMRHNKKWA